MKDSTSHSAPLQIDWEHLHHLSDGSSEFELELLQLFNEDTQTQIELLKEAIATENFRTIEEAAHHIKGAASNVGTVSIQAIATEIERQARQKQTATMNALTSELERLLHQLQVFLASS